MPISANDLLKKLLTKAGVAYDGDFSADIPDEVATGVDNNLMTLAAAVNNHPQVKKVYFAQAYNGLDAEINDLITEFGLSDEIKAEIERAGGSTKKAVALARKIKETAASANPADKDAATKHAAAISDLHSKLAIEVKKQTDLEAKYNNDLKQIKVGTKLQGLLGGYKTVFDDMPADAKEAAINSLLSKALQDSDADFTFDEKGNLSLIKKDGTNLFGDNHTLVTPASFIDKSLSKILKVTDPKQGNTTTAATVQGAQQNQSNSALSAALAESKATYEAASKIAI